jgi:predicted HTH domain antitoxin
MTSFQVAYPAELLALSGQPPEQLERLAREALLVRLYDLGEVSSGQAATVLGVARREFLDLLGTYHVSVFDESADIDAELQRSTGGPHQH